MAYFIGNFIFIYILLVRFFMKKHLFTLILLLAFAALKAQTYFSEDFSNGIPAGWQNISKDSDTAKWNFNPTGKWVFSRTWDAKSQSVPTYYKPNNWLITSAVVLDSAKAGVRLTFDVNGFDANFYKESYKVMLSTTTNDTTAFTTTLISEILPSSGWLTRKINLDAYIGDTIYLAFIHNTTTEENALYLDNIKVSQYPKQEIALTQITLPDYAQKNANLSVKGTIQNMGDDTLTSYLATYSIDGGVNVIADTVKGIKIPYMGTHSFTHSIPAKIDSAGIHSIVVKVFNPNGIADSIGNNSLTGKISIYNASVARKVLLEHFTTAKCPNCPPAHTNIETWTSTRPNLIWLAHHAGYYTDGLTVSESETMMTFYNAGGGTYAPAIMLDRVKLSPAGTEKGPVFFPSTSYTPGLLDVQLAKPAFVTVNFSNATFNQETRELSVTVSGEFVDNIISSDLRLSLYAQENNLKTTPGQSGSQLGLNYIHNHVMRKAISDVWGDKVITNGNKGTTYTKTFTYTLPSAWKVSDVSLIAFVSEYNTDVNNRQVFNAEVFPLSPITSVSDDVTAGHVSLYPNPATSELNIRLANEGKANYTICNIEGKTVKQGIANQNDIIDIKALPAGMYILKLISNDKVNTLRFVKE